MKKNILVLVVSIALIGFSAESCITKKNTGKTKGKQQPKNGRMPCPMKDC